MDDKKKKELAIRSSAAEYLTFVASAGESDTSFEMRYEDENIWLTQKMMSALYDVSKQTISQHIKRIYADGELTPEATVRKYFERQLQQIREIRLSERKFYQKVTDLYATAFDYDKNAKTTCLFFQTVQNKMHFAVHRHTAAELIAEQAKLHAETEYEKYRIIQDRLYESDFDRFLMLEQEVNHKDEV